MHTDRVQSVAFSTDGSRIVVVNRDQTTKVWDARTGQELGGEAGPSTMTPSRISPDGRWFAHAFGNRVEVVPLQPDEEELAYRRLWTQPNFRLYRENYEAAKQAEDNFATRFYFNLFPAPEQKRIQAEEIVGPLFADLHLREDVLAELHAHPATDPAVQAACLNAAETTEEDASQCHEAAWALVSTPGAPEADYRHGLRLARAACRLAPEDANFLNTRGVAEYRNRLFVDALATLTRSNELHKGKQPADLAFLALTQHRLGRTEAATTTLRRLRDLMKTSKNQEDQAFLREAELIELDRVFPADPFKR